MFSDKVVKWPLNADFRACRSPNRRITQVGKAVSLFRQTRIGPSNFVLSPRQMIGAGLSSKVIEDVPPQTPVTAMHLLDTSRPPP